MDTRKNTEMTCGTDTGTQKTRFVTLKEAAAQTGLPDRYLRDLYRFPGQNFAIKRDPRKERSRIYYDLEKFYAWLEKSNKRAVRR